ncbi:MAG: hypothetical protein D3916_04995 [Candidatus Electrothrix sp. MAN1_4]|nr:hypothetical protein [Candidatus Electrothrix sp. MAN1_4]
MIDFLENLIAALSEAKKRILNGCSDFIKGLVELLEVLYEVFVEIVQSIWEYLVRFFLALCNLLWVLIQLFLFYVPAIGMYYYFIQGADIGGAFPKSRNVLFLSGAQFFQDIRINLWN